MEKEREKIKEREKEFTVNFAELGRKFELTPGSIQAAIARACAEVLTCSVLTIVTPSVTRILFCFELFYLFCSYYSD